MKYILIVFFFVFATTAYADTYTLNNGIWVKTNTYILQQGKWTLDAPKVATDTLFERIGYCESGHSLTAKSLTSSATGEYQWIRSSWTHYGLELWGNNFYNKNIKSLDNRELAWYVYNKYGTGDWDSSKTCWGSYAKL